MKTWTIEVYELQSSKYEVEGETLQDALASYEAGEGEIVDDSTEFIETYEHRGNNGIRSILTPEGKEIPHDKIEKLLSKLT